MWLEVVQKPPIFKTCTIPEQVGYDMIILYNVGDTVEL